MPRPSRFSHVVLQSFDMPRLKEWYCKAFDLEVLAESPRAAIATYDDEHHRFAFTQLPGAAPSGERDPQSLKHVAYAYSELRDLVEQYLHLKSLGVVPKECVNHGPTVSFYYEDPDGNGVEFFVDRFATMEEAKAFIRSPVFQKNLFGYLIDPETVVQQFNDGLAADDIMRYEQAAADRFVSDPT